MLVNVHLHKYQGEQFDVIRVQNKDDAEFIDFLNWKVEKNRTAPEQTGIYIDYGLNFSNDIIERLPYQFEYPVLGEVTEFKFDDRKEAQSFGTLSPYGVCDTVEQVLEHYKSDLENPDRKFCISFNTIVKAEQPESGGWRWNKWGSYIGTHDRQCEYLYDE
jgi:hypothetical protein